MKRLHAAGRLGIALAAAGCARGAAHEAPPEGAPAVVSAAVAHEELLPVTYYASGAVRGRNTTVLTSKTTGYVRAILVHSGDRVTAGQPLVELEANDVRASVARARAAVDRSAQAKAEAESALVAARANAKIARSTYERAASLLKDNVIPPQQFEEAEARWHAAQAQEQVEQARVRAVGSTIDEAKATLGEANATLGYAVITAPFAGRVLERSVDPGALAAPGAPLLVIADEGRLRVEASVEESRADDVKVGDEASVTIETLAKPVVGTIGEIVPSVDATSRAFLVKVDLPPEASRLHPGTFARVGFRVGARPRLVVPTAAITSLGAIDRIFVIENGRARLRMITRGEAEGPWTEVLSGVAKGEPAVGKPGADLRDGAPVEVRP